MTLIIENDDILTEALHCCSHGVTRGVPADQRYGRGLIVGLRAAYRSLGCYLSVVDAILRHHLPGDVDPACFPHDFPGVYLRKGRFVVHEHFNGFSLEDTQTGQTHWLSDGVDRVPITDDGEYLSPGEAGFVEVWMDDMNANEAETLEAYFPDQAQMEAEGKVKCVECGMILEKDDAEFHNNRAGKPEPYCPTCCMVGEADDPRKEGLP